MLDNEKIGRNIYHLRKGANMTQSELSEQLGISHQAVSKWENGECLPDIEVLLNLAGLFGRSVEEILLGSTGPFQPTSEVKQTMWEGVLSDIQGKIHPKSYQTWFSGVAGKVEGDTLVVTCPNPFTTDWLRGRYSFMIEEALEKRSGKSGLGVVFRSGQ
ncbi:helix-turn-helix transcriptional regulator [Paenibacillus sp. CAU 1782]